MEAQASNLCSGCLAVGRRMLLITDTQREQCFMEIIRELAMTLPNSALWLCWECEANITRFTKFKKQVKHAYKVLNDFTIQTESLDQKPSLGQHEAFNISLPPPINDTDLISICTETSIPTEISIPTETSISTDIIKAEIFKTQIKYETDITDDDDDDQPLIDICNDTGINDNQISASDNSNGKIQRNGKIDKSKRDDKLRLNGKLKRNAKAKHNGKSKHSGNLKDNENGKSKHTDKLKDNENGKLKRSDKLKENGKLKCSGKIKSKSIFREIELTEEEIVEERNHLALREDYVNAMFRCERCLVTFSNEDDMKEHDLKKHEMHASKHRCSICSCAFNSEMSIAYHRRRHVRRFECSLCSFRCTSKLAARNHCATVHLQSSSYDLERTYNDCDLETTDNDLNSTKDAKFACEHCPKVFGWKTSLRKHLETHKIEAGQKRKPYCEPCSLTFSTTANLQKHARTSSKHQIQLKLRKMKETNPAESSDKLIADITTSINRMRQSFPCPQCDKTFQWRGNLLRHLHSHAARAAGSLVCAPCDRTFSSLATYTQHMRVSRKHVSENDFKYMCRDCGRKFANKTKLTEHIDWEHLKNYVHTCTDCQKVFKSHTSLYIHRQVVHQKSSSQHLCETCGKSFPNQTKLRSHIIALHTSESPYKCGVCGARFSWHSCLSRHLRRVHRTDK